VTKFIKKTRKFFFEFISALLCELHLGLLCEFSSKMLYVFNSGLLRGF